MSPKSQTSKSQASKKKSTSPAQPAKTSLPKGKYIYATGRRKEAVARVRLYKEKDGDITINDKDYKIHFPTAELQFLVRQPLVLVGQASDFKITVKVNGGGVRGQAEAVRHGIARALEESDEKLRAALKKAGFLRRDPRMKERKKPGLKKARRAPQWQKR